MPTQRPLQHRVFGSRLEELESRDCPSVFYKYEVLARTGDTVSPPGQTKAAEIVSLDRSPSLNSNGLAAFTAGLDSSTPNYVLTRDPSGRLEALNTFGHQRIDVGPVNENGHFVTIASSGARGGIDSGGVFTLIYPTQIERFDGAAAVGVARTFTDLAEPFPGAGKTTPRNFNFLSVTPSINNNGDIAYTGRRAGIDTSSEELYVQGKAAGLNDGTLLAGYTVQNSRVLQPSLADTGAVVGQAGSDPTSPIVLYEGGNATTIAGADGWDALGSRPSITADGRVVVFYGDPAGPLPDGIFASVKKANTRDIVRLAGVADGADGLTGFSPDGRVSVNNTLAGQRAVTVAYKAVGTQGVGIYTTRLNYFGSRMKGSTFDADAPVTVAAATPTPVVKVGDTVTGLGAPVEDFDVGEGVNSRDRGDVVFWCKTTAGEEAIVRGRPRQVLYLDFDPQLNTAAGLSLDAAAVYQGNFLDKNGNSRGNVFFKSGTDGGLEGAIRQAGGSRAKPGGDLYDTFGLADRSPTLRGLIQDGVQRVYSDAKANVEVVTAKPTEGQFTTVAIGNQDNETSNVSGYSLLDAFNQDVFIPDSRAGLVPVFEPGFAGVFVNRLFSASTQRFNSKSLFKATPSFIGLSDPGILVSSPITAAEVVTAIATIAAHEVGHSLGLLHLPNAATADLLMHQNSNEPVNGLRTLGRFSTTDETIASKTATTVKQNDQARLAFAVGSDIEPNVLRRQPPNLLADEFGDRSDFDLTTAVPAGLRVLGAVLGVRPADDDAAPLIIDLGAGDLATLLRRPVPLAPGDRVFFFGTTAGTGIDVYSLPTGVPAGTPLDMSNPYSILTNDRVLSAPADAAGDLADTALRIIRVTGGTATDIGGAGGNPDAAVPPTPPPPPAAGDSLIVDSEAGLFRLNVDGSATLLGRLTFPPADLAVDANGTIYAIGYDEFSLTNTILYRLDVGVDGVTADRVGALGVQANALAFAPDGSLVAAAFNRIYRIDLATGAAAEVTHSPQSVFPGDLAFGPGGEAYLTSDGTGGSQLLRVEAGLTTWSVVGNTGVGNLDGLRFSGDALVGYGKGGAVYRIDPATAAAALTGTLAGVGDVVGAAGPAAPPVPPTVPPPPPTPRSVRLGSPQFAVAADDGVSVRNPDGSVRTALDPFPGFAGQVRTAVADVNRDGVGDVLVGTGPGTASRVRLLDGADGAELFAFDPFEGGFTGGVYVAAADVTGDGVADLVVTPDEGGGPRVRVFSGAGFAPLADFFAIDDPNFRGGARAAGGDLNGDGVADLLVSAGFGGGPRLAAFDGKTLGGSPVKLFGDFFAFEPTLRNGAFVAAGDVDGDGYADVVAGGGPGGGPRVTIFSGRELVQGGRQTTLANFFAGDGANRGGVRLAVKDLDGDNRADVVAGSGPGGGSRVTAYRGSTLSAGRTPPEAFAFDALPGSLGGAFVG